MVKSPKLYWRDSGLVHALLDLGKDSDLFVQPWVGSSWEGWVVEQILGHLQSFGESYQAFYLRTSDQREIDLLLEYRGKLWAFEIKLSSVPDTETLKRLKDTAALVSADSTVLISRTSKPVQGKEIASLNLAAALEMLLG